MTAEAGCVGRRRYGAGLAPRVALGLLACAVAAGSPAEAVQEQRIALVLGQNKGQPGTVDLRYAEQDAQRVAEVLGELGGFQKVDVHKGVTAPSVLSLLDGLAGQVRRAQRAGQRVLFILYYSGHADDAGLQLGHSYLPRERLLAALSALGAETTVVVVDACQTGGLNRRKGVTVVPPRQLAMVDRLATRGRVIIASSAPGEDSQESDRLRGSFFTSHWVAALRGGADANRDGVVELREAYDYAYHRTIGSTVTSVAGTQHPTHQIELAGERDISLTWPGRSAAAVRIEAEHAGSFVVLSQDASRVYAEVSLSSGQAVRIGLPPGNYAITKRTAEGLLRGEISLREGQSVRVDEARLERQAYTVLATKFGRTEGWMTLTAGMAADLVGVGLHPSLDVGYVIDFGPLALWPALAGAFGRDSGDDFDVDTIALEPQLAALLPLHWNRFVTLVGARASVPLYWQRSERLPNGVSVGVGIDAVFAAAIWVARYVGVVLQLHVGTRGAQVTPEGDAGQSEGSFGWRWAGGGSLGLRIRL